MPCMEEHSQVRIRIGGDTVEAGRQEEGTMKAGMNKLQSMTERQNNRVIYIWVNNRYGVKLLYSFHFNFDIKLRLCQANIHQSCSLTWRGRSSVVDGQKIYT